MSLPIIRLRTVDAHSVTMADDPVTASCTLYTFLRSVPSSVECDMAMEDFRRAAQTAPAHSFLAKSNARVLCGIDASVTDGLLRHPPKVSPIQARRANTWRRMLLLDAPIETDAPSSPPPQPPRCAAAAGESASLTTSYSSEWGRAEVHTQRPLSSPTPSSPMGAALAQEDVSAALVHAPDGASPGAGDACRAHPLLLEVIRRVRAAQPADENDDDRREREFATMMESRTTALRTKLSSAMAQIPQGNEDAVQLIQQLQTRLETAWRLFSVTRYEQETLQMAECAVRIEVATMRALLCRVADAVADAEERHERDGPNAPFYAEECHLMAAMQRALDELPPS